MSFKFNELHSMPDYEVVFVSMFLFKRKNLEIKYLYQVIARTEIVVGQI